MGVFLIPVRIAGGLTPRQHRSRALRYQSRFYFDRKRVKSQQERLRGKSGRKAVNGLQHLHRGKGPDFLDFRVEPARWSLAPQHCQKIQGGHLSHF